MILLYTPKISNRIKYIASLLLEGISGFNINFTDKSDEYLNYKGPRINYSQIPLSSDEVFIYSHGLLSHKGLKLIIPQVAKIDSVPVIFSGMSDHCHFGFDIFAASFFFVSRYEEHFPFKGDAHGRFEANQSIAYKNGFLETPVVNIYAKMLSKALIEKFNLVPESSATFDIMPTYDIDNAYAYKGKGFFRSFAASLANLFTMKFDVLAERIKVLSGKMQDPFDTYEYLIDIQKKYNFLPKYFFLAADYGPFDKNIYVFSKRFESIVKMSGDYAEIGLHPSYASFNSPNRFEMELKRFSKIANQPINHCRQHFIRMRFPDTYQTLIDNNVFNDYTMGYATHTGFRAGICSPYFYYDLEKEQITKLKIYPYSAMDLTLNKYMSLSPEKATEKLNDLLNTVKSVNGLFISVFHNDSFCERGIWKGWRKVYENMIEKATLLKQND
jgi:hypothetical protein